MKKRLLPLFLSLILLTGFCLHLHAHDGISTEAVIEQAGAAMGGIEGESINLFTGSVGYKVTETVLKGPAGLDLVLSRSYNEKGKRQWQFDVPHFSFDLVRKPETVLGDRIWKIAKEGERGGLLYLPGRSPIVLVQPGSNALNHELYDYVSLTEKWNGKFVSGQEGESSSTFEFEFFTPDGLKYELSQTYTYKNVGSSVDSSDITLTGLTAVISDQHGNNITYVQSESALTINASDGRSATVTYAHIADPEEGVNRYKVPYKKKVLDKLVVSLPDQGNREWIYEYKHHKDVSKALYCSGLNSDDRTECQRGVGDIEGLYVLYYHRLWKVTDPESQITEYTYRRLSEDVYLSNVNTPLGVDVTYEMKFEQLSASFPRRLMLASRTLSGHALESSTKTFNYDLTLQTTSRQTTVRGPAKTVVSKFYHDTQGNDALWGELLSLDIYEADDATLSSPVRTEEYFYNTDVKPALMGALKGTSNIEHNKHTRFAPLYKVVIDGKYQTEYTALDEQWNWTVKTETTGSNTRVTTTDYFYQINGEDGRNHIGYVDSQVITGEDKTWVSDYTYNALGQLTQKIEDGITSSYNYNDNGDLEEFSYSNHLDNPHKIVYTNYKRGIAQTETYPATVSDINGHTITRVINDSGTIRSETDGRGHTTSFTYDDMNRLTKVDPEGLNSTKIEYSFSDSGNKVKVTRELSQDALDQILEECSNDDTCVEDLKAQTEGDYEKEISLDGLGRKLLVKESGTGISPVYASFDYDAAGRQTFVSRTTNNANETSGITTEYDALDRPIRVADSELTEATHYCYGVACFLALFPVTQCNLLDPECVAEASLEIGGFSDYYAETDTNQETTSYFLNGFGGLEQSWPEKIVQPEDITTLIDRDVLGQVESVSRGSVERVYDRDTFFINVTSTIGTVTVTNGYTSGTSRIKSITEPERDKVTYTYDPSGNLRTKSVGLLPSLDATYSYDSLNRLSGIDYVEVRSPDHAYLYHETGQIKQMSNGIVKRTYDYTPFGALSSETLSVGSPGEEEVFELGYGYNANGFLDSLTYPNNHIADYDVDDFGRITNLNFGEVNLAKDITYHPTNTIHKITYGNDVTTTYGQNNRQLVDSVKALFGSDDRLNLSYSYDGELNVTSITDGIDSNNSITSLTYDGINRLNEAVSPKWGTAKFRYDAKGNITSKDMGSLGSLSYQYHADSNRLFSVTGAESRTYSYDELGNATSNGVHNFLYNDAGRMLQVTDSTTSEVLLDYLYDAEGIKVMEFKNGDEGTALYTVYSQAGDLLYEKDPESGIESNYIQLGNQNIAKINTGCIGTDTDADGISDCKEIKFGLDPYDDSDAALDRDSDGLTNAQEVVLGTKLDSADSDNDGMDDKWEVDNGLDPLVNDANLDNDGDGITNLDEYINRDQSGGDSFNVLHALPAILHVLH